MGLMPTLPGISSGMHWCIWVGYGGVAALNRPYRLCFLRPLLCVGSGGFDRCGSHVFMRPQSPYLAPTSIQPKRCTNFSRRMPNAARSFERRHHVPRVCPPHAVSHPGRSFTLSQKQPRPGPKKVPGNQSHQCRNHTRLETNRPTRDTSSTSLLKTTKIRSAALQPASFFPPA